MGETVALGAGLALEARVPPVGEAVVRLFRDGEVIHEVVAGGPVRVRVGAPGAYRVEVDLQVDLFPIATARRMPWIFSNAIYVRP